MERKIIFLDGREEIIDDDKSLAFEHGKKGYVYKYGDSDCLKACVDAIATDEAPAFTDKKVELLKRISDLNHSYIYKIDEFFKTRYDHSSKYYGYDRILFAGYTMKYYQHFQNDINDKGEECFNALRVPCDKLEEYFNQVFEAVLFLTEHHFEVHDLHRKNIAKGKDCFTIIDCDEYCYNKDIITMNNNIQQLGFCFAELLSKGLHYSFGVGTENEIRDNDIYSIYHEFVENNLINYKKYNLKNMYDFLKILKEYNTPEEYFEDEFKLVKRIR